MKKFISNLFIILIVGSIFNLIIFIFANDNYYKDYNTFPSKKYHSFFLADSHGMSLEKYPEKYGVYNFSENSDSYFDMKRKIAYLIENHYKLKTIYITVDDHTLSPYRDKINNADKSIVYTSEVNTNYLKEKYLKYYFPIFQVKVNPLFRIYLEGKVDRFFQGNDQRITDVIWSKLLKVEQVKRAEDRVAGQFPSKYRSTKLSETLVEIIELCQKNNIELVGIKFPLSQSYLEKLENRNYGADRLFISKGLKVLDYKPLFVNKDDYFGDQDHLGPKGGEEFIKIMMTKKTPLKSDVSIF